MREEPAETLVIRRANRVQLVRRIVFYWMVLLTLAGHSHQGFAEGGDISRLNVGFSSKAFVTVPKEDVRVAVGILTRNIARKAALAANSRVYDSTVNIERDLKGKK